jgi:hypothetical protein
VKQLFGTGVAVEELTEFDIGFLIGLLVGEGHFGGDGRQPQITLKMHTDHEAVFHWLVDHFPGGRLYGPYFHGGRHYYQWMARGAYLRDVMAPLIASRLRPEHSERVYGRFNAMLARYPRFLFRTAAVSPVSQAGEESDPGTDGPASAL